MPTLSELRTALGTAAEGRTDEDLMRAYAGATGASPAQVANAFGYDAGGSGKWTQRGSASVDSYQAGLWGFGEALAGAAGATGLEKSMAARRRANEFAADAARGRAQALGAVMDWRDVAGPGDLADLTGGLLVDSAPYVVEAMLGGTAARGLMTGTRGAITAAREIGDAAAARAAGRRLAAGELTGGAAASYPSSTGDILQSQRDQAGKTDIGSALIGGVPYAAANAVGLEGAAARSSLFRNGIGALDRIPGKTGLAVRAAATGAGVGAQEGANELAQEAVNQYFGRMAVDPNAQFADEAARKRYIDSFIGGALAGGAAGAMGGGWRRSGHFGENSDLLQGGGDKTPQQLALSYDPSSSGAIIVFPDGSASTAADLPEARTMYAGRNHPGAAGVAELTPSDMPSGVVVPGVRGVSQDYYSGALPFEAVAVEPRAPERPSAGRDILAYGQSPLTGDLLPPVGNPDVEPAPAAAPAPDTSTIDLFQATPSAAVRTDFSQRQIAQELRQANGGKLDTFVAQLSKVLSDHIDTGEAPAIIDKLQEKLESSKLVPATTDRRARVLEAARGVVERFQQRMTDAYAQEAQARGPRPGERVAPDLPASTTEQDMREANAAVRGQQEYAAQRAAVAALDERVQQGREAASAAQRRDILDQVLGDPTTHNPVGRFTAALKKAGFTDTSVRPDEAQSIARYEDARAAFSGGARPQGRQVAAAPARPTESPTGRKGDVQAGAAAPVEDPRIAELRSQLDRLAASLSSNDQPGATAAPAARPVARPAARGAIENMVQQSLRGQSGAVAETSPPKSKPRARVDSASDPKVADAKQRLRAAARDRANSDDYRGEARDFIEALDDPKASLDDLARTIAATDKLLSQDGKHYEAARPTTSDLAPVADKLHGTTRLTDALELVRTIASPAQRRLIDRLLDGGRLDGAAFRFYNPDAATAADSKAMGYYESGVVSVNRGLGDVQTLLHESVHADTARLLDEQITRGADGWAASGADGQRLLDLYNRALAADTDGHYGLADPHEFVAEAFTNPEFQDFLSSIPGDAAPNRSLWQAFVDAVRRVLGLPVQATTLLDDVLRHVGQWVEGRAAESAAAPKEAAAAPRHYRTDDAKAFKLPEPESHGRMASAFNTLVGRVTDWRNTPGVLGLLSMRQLGDRFTEAKSYVDTYLRMGQRAEQLMSELGGVLTKWRNLPGDAQRSLSRVMLEATMLRAHPDRDFAHESNAHLRGDEEAAAAHRALQAKFDALTPRAKEVYAQARDAMQRQWEAMSAARLSSIVRLYSEALSPYFSDKELTAAAASPKRLREQLKSDSEYANMSVSARRALRNLLDAADEHHEQAGQMKGPYFPLVRFGDHVVVARSTSFHKALDDFAAAREKLQELYDTDPPADEKGSAALDQKIDAAREEERQARSALELLKGSDRHYSVSFFERRWEAEAYRKQLEADPSVAKHGLEVAVEQRARHYQQFDSASPQFMRQLEDSLRRVLPSADVGSVRDAVRELYRRSLPDRSALKSELRRLNVPGARSTEMMRGLASRGMGNSWRISRMEHGTQLQERLADMRRSHDRDTTIVGDEMAKRLLIAMTPPERAPVTAFLSQAAHLTFLGLSPSYALTNATQPWVISLPVMAARHGWAAAGKALGDASLEVMRSMRALQATEHDRLSEDRTPMAALRSLRFDIQPEQLGKTDAEKTMLRSLFNDGLINITLEHDIASTAEGAEGGWLSVASRASSTPAHLVEVVNRVATALAAFRLEQRRDASEQGYANSALYAQRVVAETHLDYSAENAPRLMRSDSLGGLGRLVFQFKKYTQGMLYLLSKLMRDSWRVYKEKGFSEAMRSEHLKAFAYLNGMTMAVAGTTGLPVAGAAGLLFKAVSKLWDDDDEPDLGQMFYNGMKDAVGDVAARAIVKGLPAALGVDLSQRLGQGSLTNPFQFVSTGRDQGRDVVKDLLLGIAGPSAAMLANWADAASVADSDPRKAWQLALPRFASDPLKALDRADRGIVSRSGNEVMSASEFDLTRGVLKALGMESTAVSDLYEQRAAVNEAVGKMHDARNKLMRQWAEARRTGEGMAEVQAEVNAFNLRNPAARITYSTLLMSARRREHPKGVLDRGVRVAPRDADVLDQVE